MARVVRRQHGAAPESGRATLPALVDAVKALAHPGRLRMLAMLRGGDLCVCQLTAVLELAASTVSSHLSDLRRAGIVTERRSGKWVHYRLVPSGPLADLVREALRLADDDRQLGLDAQVVAELRRIPLETFCRTGAAASGSVGRRPRAAQRRNTP
jgi:ArsR family transcriptional regulator, arsenate/arsenite/antimonite-responsive transcriptional repressor